MNDKSIRKKLVLAIIFLFFGASISSTTGLLTESLTIPESRAFLYVGGSGPGNYTKIQDAIDNATDGDTIFVYNGTYYEHIIIDKKIELIGQTRDTTTIDGGLNDYDVILIIANAVNISCFTVKNAGWGTSSGILINGNNSIIRNVNFSGGQDYGIGISAGSGNVIYNCIFSSSFICGINNFFGVYNHIFHNNFINNSLQAYDININYWDNNFPSGGNYWDDYHGEDLYSGPNQDIPGPDGIGDVPYNITGGDNKDQYPLIHPFEQYYILNISAPEDVTEGELFNVLVTTIGGTLVPNATVDFNDELKLTGPDGRVYFFAPQVGEDIYYNITTMKEGYTSYTEIILIKDIPYEFEPMFIVGKIDNVITEGDIISFEAERIMIVDFYPFGFLFFNGYELIIVEKVYWGIVDARIIFALCYTYLEI